MNGKRTSAIRLYVFIEDDYMRQATPLEIILNKHRTILDLKAFVEKHKRLVSNRQYWIINRALHPSRATLSQCMIENAHVHNGFWAVLFHADTCLEEAFNQTEIEHYFTVKYAKLQTPAWKPPNERRLIFPDPVNMLIPDLPIGWSCPTCSFVNEPSRPGCSQCSHDRPEDYVPPPDYLISDHERHRLNLADELESLFIKAELVRERQEIAEKDERYVQLIRCDDLRSVPNPNPIECPICNDDIAANDGIRLRNCFHDMCKVCLGQYIVHLMDPEAKCPIDQCEFKIEDREIKAVLTEEQYNNYSKLVLKTAEGQEKYSFHCKTADCAGWVINDLQGNSFTCPLCRHTSCTKCNLIHEGKTCKQYHDDLRINDDNEKAAVTSVKVLEDMLRNGAAKRCPGCNTIVQKNGGCDNMKCTMCRMAFSWATGRPR